MFYHGTSSNLKIKHKLVSPSISGKLAETGRGKNLDKVFFTTSFKYAQIYAKKSVQKFGGEPIVFRVMPPQNLTKKYTDTKGCDIYTADYAWVELLNKKD